MKFQGIDKFEYKYVQLGTNLPSSMKTMNGLGQEGWELIELFSPYKPLSGDIYKGLFKRKITEVTV